MCLQLDYDAEQTLFLGDLCEVDGYERVIWEAVRCSLVYDSIIYDLVNVFSGDWITRTQEEVMLVCRAQYAFEYVEELDENGMSPTYEFYTDTHKNKEEKLMLNNTEKNRKISFTYPDTIDGLLMKLTDLSIRKEEHEKYEKIDYELEAEIEKVVAELTKRSLSL